VHERAPLRLVGGMQEFGGGGVWGNGVDILERVDAIFSQCFGVPGTYDTLAACDHGVILIHIYI